MVYEVVFQPWVSIALNATEVMGLYLDPAYWNHNVPCTRSEPPKVLYKYLVKSPCVTPSARHIIIAIPVFVPASLIVDKVLLSELLLCRALIV